MAAVAVLVDAEVAGDWLEMDEGAQLGFCACGLPHEALAIVELAWLSWLGVMIWARCLRFLAPA